MQYRALFIVAISGLVLGCSFRGGGKEGSDAGPEDGDGGPMGPQVVECETELSPPSSEACDVEAGAGTKVMVLGDVLTPDATYQDGAVVYEGDTIVCVGCDCATDSANSDATKITCTGSAISAGLVNAHDHLQFNEGAPIDVGTKRYNHRHEWRRDLSTPGNPNGSGQTSNGMRWCEIRQLAWGTTSHVSTSRALGGMRNLKDLTDEEEARGFPGLDFQTFSLGDSSSSSTLRSNCDWDYSRDEEDIAGEAAFLPHVAEGIDEYAAEEFRCQSTSFDGGRDFTESNTAHIHSVGLQAIDYWHMAHDKAQLVWSPRSNISLYGVTAGVQIFDRFGGVLALGTDWTYSGSASVARELACADEYNRNNLDTYFSDHQLWMMATLGGAQATNTEDLIGSLEVGKIADIAVFTSDESRYHRAVIEALSGDVALVVQAGVPLYGETDIVTGLGENCETTEVCGSMRALCAEREYGDAFSVIANDVPGSYPAFFCGVPADEPTCIPSRPGEYSGVASAEDSDGDGFSNDTDNCPNVFNPVRPIDNGVQPDYDGDGEGDACDDSPLVADIDSDGIDNAADNCPFQANDGQDDGDADNKGDVCDFCPAVKNELLSCPAAAAVPYTIEEIQTGDLPDGTAVTVEEVVVSAIWSSGYWLQDPAGGANSGIAVYDSGHSRARGDVLTLTGKVEEYYSQTEISDVDLTILDKEIPLPAPAEITAAQAATEDYEGVLVTITDAVVSSADYDCADDDEKCADEDLWALNDDSIIVYDRAYEGSDWNASAGTVPVTGVMMIRYEKRRVLPRIDEDFGD